MKIQLNFNSILVLRIFAGMKWLRNIALPLVPLYYIGALLNKKLYDWNIKKTTTYNFPIITVGNLSVGGTGKSPMVAYLISLLEVTNKVATLSRGYKRQTKGFQEVLETSTALEVGDEPLQFKLNYPDAIVVVDADRKNGIRELRDMQTVPDVVLLDDAFQHRKVQAGFRVLLTAYDNLYVNDWMLPTGDLREPIAGAERAHVVMVTKCPKGISKEERRQIELALKLKKNQHLFFTFIDYALEIKSETSKVLIKDFLKEEFTLVTGIAKPKPLVDFLNTKGVESKHFAYPDHHNFSEKEIEELSKEKRILTTEKDFMRLRDFPVLKGKLYYLPITSSFIEKEEVFRKLIVDFINSFDR